MGCEGEEQGEQELELVITTVRHDQEYSVASSHCMIGLLWLTVPGKLNKTGQGLYGDHTWAQTILSIRYPIKMGFS